MAKRKPARPVFFCQCGDHAWTALTRGYITLVSPEDAHLIQQRRWTALTINKGLAYARTTFEYLHRKIIQGQETDHKNRNGLDNRRSNLRAATHQQNQANRGRWKSGFKGVRIVGPSWQATIRVSCQSIYLGSYQSPEKAALAYDKAAIKYFGEFAGLNFPQG